MTTPPTAQLVYTGLHCESIRHAYFTERCQIRQAHDAAYCYHRLRNKLPAAEALQVPFLY